MVKKLFALASVTALTGLIAAVGAAGCSSTTTVEEQPTGDDAGDGGKKKDTKDSSTPDIDTDAGSEPESCYDEGAAGTLTDKVTAEFPGNRCTEAQIDAILSGCFGTGGSEAACKAATTDAAADCGECVLGPSASKATFDLPMFVPVGDDGSGLISVYACLAVKAGKPECALPLTNSIFCPATACSACEKAESDACEKEAEEGVCKDAISKVDQACVDALNALEDDGPEVAACTGSESLKTLKAVSVTLCGPRT